MSKAAPNTHYEPTARSAFFTSMVLLLIFAAYSSFSIFHSQAADISPQDVDPSGFPELPVEEQVMNIPYFVQSKDLQSTLTLNNNQTTATTAAVTIFSAKGIPVATNAVTLQPMTVNRFKLEEMLNHVPGNSREGNIQISYHGNGMGVTSQLSIASAHTRLSFESTAVDAREFASSRLDGIVWSPNEKSESSVALTNTQSSRITSVAVSSGQEQKTIALGPRETKVIDFQNVPVKSKKGLRAILVSLEHDGDPGSIIATGFVLNQKTGFSSNLNFIDCGTAKSAKLAAAHVRLGPANPTEGFPAGTDFRAPLLIANTMHDPTDVRVSIDYTIENKANRVQLEPITLAPLEVKQIELSKELARQGVTGRLDEAGVDITYDGMPGTVIARLTSYDTGGDYSFDAPVKDPLSGANRTNGSYPWRLDNGYSTVVHLKNTTDKDVEAMVQIRYDGGTYNPDLIKLAPYQTVAIDIGQLRDNQEEDIRGALMPKEVETGQVVWYEHEHGSLIGRAEIANIKAGIASSFSCPGNCPCGFVYRSGLTNPSSGRALVGETGFMFAPREMRQDCNFIQYGPYAVTATQWFTSNSGVVSVTNSGIESCVAPGTATITPKWSTVVAYNSYSCGCCPINGFGTANAGCDVDTLRALVPNSPVTEADGSPGVIAGQQFPVVLQAINSGGSIDLAFNGSVTVTRSRTLDASEIDLPSTVNLSGGQFTQNAMFNRVNGVEQGTTFRFSPSGGGSVDLPIFTYFRVVATREGLVGGTTSCGHTITANDHFVALPATGLCNQGVVLRNTTPSGAIATTVRDVGPWFPNGTATQGNPCVGGDDPYWNTGGVPRVEGVNCDANDAGIDLADGTFSDLGLTGNVRILWRFN